MKNLLATAALLFTISASAAEMERTQLATGILYQEINAAPTLNPAGLTGSMGTFLQGAYGNGGGASDFFGGIAGGNQSVGLGGDYLGNSSEGTTNNGFTV